MVWTKRHRVFGSTVLFPVISWVSSPALSHDPAVSIPPRRFAFQARNLIVFLNAHKSPVKTHVVKNPMRKIACRTSTPNRSGSVWSTLLATCVVFGAIAGGGYWYWVKTRTHALRTDLIVAQASRGPFDHIVLEQGELESSSNVEIVCEVRARGGAQGTALLWVIEEGMIVKKGDKLVELDSSALETAQKEKRIVVIAAESAVASAEALVQQAVISRQEYLEGLFQTEERLIQSEMAIAEQGLRKSQLALESTQRLVAKGLVKSLQLEADQFAVANNRNLLEGAEGRLKVLQNLTKQKMLVQFDSAIDAAKAQLAAAQASLEEEEADLRSIEKQIKLCTIFAPADGVAIHANEFNNRGGTAEFVVEPGAIIRERQTILRLPDPKMMQVRANINESRITLIQPGMPAKIRIDAVSNMELIGRVAKVNRYAEPGSWFSSSIKEYATTIEIVDPPQTIRTGMTAEVQIFVERLPDAIQVPIQAIYEHGGKTYSLIKSSESTYETREVSIGATNEQMATIKDGVEPGDNVILNLRQNLSLMNLPKVEPEDNADLAAATTASTEQPPRDGPSNGKGGEPRKGDWQDGKKRPEGGKAPGAAGDRGGEERGSDEKGGGRPRGEGAGGRPTGDRASSADSTTNPSVESSSSEVALTTPAAESAVAESAVAESATAQSATAAGDSSEGSE